MSGYPGAVVQRNEVCDASGAKRERRDRQAAWTTRTGIAARVLYLCVRMLSVPLAMRLLKAERYGLWLAAGSLVNWLGLFELGIGSGLVNALSAAYGRGDRRQMRRHISTAVWAAALLSAVGVAIAIGLSKWHGLDQLLGVTEKPELADDAHLLVFICGTLFAFSVLTNVLGQVWSGLQKGYLVQIAFSAGTVAGLLSLIVLSFRGGSVGVFAVVVGVPPIISCLALATYFFGWKHPELRPAWSAANWPSLKVLGGTGLFLSIAQAGDLVMLCSANLLIASHLGPADVPRYAVAYSLLMFVQSVCLHFIVPFWPAYAEAIELQDVAYVRRSFWKGVRNTLALMALALAGFAVLGRSFIGLWAGPSAVPPPAVVAFLCAWFVVWTWNQNVNMVVNAFGGVRRRALGALLSAGMFLAIALVALPAIGLAAIPLAGFAGATIEGITNTPAALRRLTI